MEMRDIFRDFIHRTNENLKAIEELSGRDSPPRQVYEVTQLINSLLGFIVFPHQSFRVRIPNERLEDLKRAGWPAPRITIHAPGVRCETLPQLYRRLRNGVSHWNIEILSDGGEIVGLRVFDRPDEYSPRSVEVEMTVDELRAITKLFVDLVLAQPETKGR